MSDSFRLCLLGLPKTGKTTYLAALWAFLRSPQPEERMRVVDLPDDTAYLDAISEAWAAGAAMPRSSPEVSDHIEFTIETPDAPSITVVVPDLPGEVFLNAIRRPLIDDAPASAVMASDLVLLFVNCQSATMFEPLGDHPVPPDNSPEPPPQANDGVPPPQSASPNEAESGSTAGIGTEPALDGAHSEDRLRSQEDDKPKRRFVEFNPGDLHSDTLNTELLTRLAELVGEAGFPPLLVVVSAWDIHSDDSDLTPDTWLRDYQPMLWQHLEELGRKVSVGIVGISAQGADYGDRPEIVEVSMSERAWGCGADGVRTDIVGPILWYHRRFSDNG